MALNLINHRDNNNSIIKREQPVAIIQMPRLPQSKEKPWMTSTKDSKAWESKSQVDLSAKSKSTDIQLIQLTVVVRIPPNYLTSHSSWVSRTQRRSSASRAQPATLTSNRAIYRITTWSTTSRLGVAQLEGITPPQNIMCLQGRLSTSTNRIKWLCSSLKLFSCLSNPTRKANLTKTMFK